MGISFDKKATSTLTITRKSIVSGKSATDVTILSNQKCTEPMTPSKSFLVDENGIVSGVKRLVETFFETSTQLELRQADRASVDDIDYKISYFETGKFGNKYHYQLILERAN